ncbi:solute carrier family 2, facilitated glucose transporter member 8-like [Haliotis rufescens]|uniref:solute carrier family 2, facilitated glucose transporter member 8-like n=1 Tax=Haliotis rufescens TaxID=6454 RepID=UPI00201E81C6|nr:solute carrier family 2, facilitated glucose transporter member 8-like [Haliotis rufescens]
MASLEAGARLVQSKYEGSPRRLIWTTLIACLGALCFGYVIGYSSPAIPSMIKSGVLNKQNAGWFGSLMTVGAILGGPSGGYCIEKFGRRKSLIIATVPFLLGWVAMLTSSTLTYLYAGRFLTGFSSGLVTVCVPVYIAEISTKSMRGVLGSCTQLFITVGILLAYACGLHFDWRGLALIGAIQAVTALVMSFFIPETPRWLLGRNQKAEAIQALKALRDSHMDVQEECRDIEEGLDPQEDFAWSEFLQKPELSRPLFIALTVFVFQQLSGINAVMFYTVSIFETAIPDLAHGATVAVGAIQVVATFAACLLMDRAGRRKLLIIAGLIMSATLFMFGLYYKLQASNSLNSTMKTWLPVCSLMIYIVGFSLGWGPIPMLVMSEIFPSRARGAASSIAILGNWLVAFVVTKEFMTMQTILGQDGTFYLFAMFCLMSVMFVWKYLPETKGKSLEDIELYFLGRTLIDK